MNKKILGLIATCLLAGPLSAHAAGISSCTVLADETLDCDLFESGVPAIGNTLIDLNGYPVSAGFVAISEEGQPDVIRNVLEFIYDLDTDSYFLRFYFGSNLPAGPFANPLPRTGSLTTYSPVAYEDPTNQEQFLNHYRVHHDGNQVPEPGSLALLGLGLVGLGVARRRKSK